MPIYTPMATYLKFLALNDTPFEGPKGGKFVLATEALRRAYAEIKRGLDDDSPRICISGGTGIGKSSLAAALPKLLGNDFRSVLIRDPSLPWKRIEAVLVRQLNLTDQKLSRSTLELACRDGQRIVLILDQAEKLDAESLEQLDKILGYRSEQDQQLVRCVLLANLESAPRGSDVPLLWWLDQLTTLQLQFSPIPEDGIRAYVDKHLKKAGWRGESLFSDEAIRSIHRYTGGIPGTVGALCEELLARAAEARVTRIDVDLVRAQCEPDSVGDFSKSAAQRDSRREPMLPQAPDGEPAAWPELGPPSDAPTRVAPEAEHEHSANLSGESGLELKVEQGLVPMDEREAPTSSLDDFLVRPSEPSWGAGTRRSLPPQAPAKRSASGGLKFVLSMLAIATAAYYFWPVDGPIPRPRLSKPIPPPAASLVDASQNAPNDPADAVLTPDLRVPDTRGTKPRPEVGPAGGLRLSSEQQPGARLTRARPEVERQMDSYPQPEASHRTRPANPLGREPNAEPELPVFEPWADQQPESLSAESPSAASAPPPAGRASR